MDVVREFRTAAVRLHVLHHAAEGEVHGAWMSTELGHHGHRISAGTLYPLLHRMEEAGLLMSHTKVVDGRRLRLYRATSRGRTVLRQCRSALSELADELVPS
ncbi:PadR family transcriptional regulator [Aeromicrobium sp.]|uniref:PadR family transcriptional regulator n=1 Tax=Aeromicrobium sp. TaxID=1871063 RepID=UPI003D6B43A9